MAGITEAEISEASKLFNKLLDYAGLECKSDEQGKMVLYKVKNNANNQGVKADLALAIAFLRKWLGVMD